MTGEQDEYAQNDQIPPDDEEEENNRNVDDFNRLSNGSRVQLNHENHRVSGDLESLNDENTFDENEHVNSLDVNGKKSYMIQLYQRQKPLNIGKETLDNIKRIVRNNVVRNVKFISHENTSGLSKTAAEGQKKFPSFWQPNLLTKKSIQQDIFNEFPEYEYATLTTKVRAWLGMRDKVFEAIRGHRNATQTAIQKSVVEGKPLRND